MKRIHIVGLAVVGVLVILNVINWLDFGGNGEGQAVAIDAQEELSLALFTQEDVELDRRDIFHDRKASAKPKRTRVSKPRPKPKAQPVVLKDPQPPANPAPPLEMVGTVLREGRRQAFVIFHGDRLTVGAGDALGSDLTVQSVQAESMILVNNSTGSTYNYALTGSEQ